MNDARASVTLLAGFQWLFFMFANTVVIPISVGEAFGLNQVEIVSAMQRSFMFTGIACILQGLIGHRYAIMEGQSGLWWGVILSLTATASTLPISLATIGGSIAVGAIFAGLLVSTLALFGLGDLLKKWFTPVVMFVFLLLLANQLIFIFLQGMLGLNESDHINVTVASFSIVLATLTIVLNIKGRGAISNLSLLIGMVVGWIGAFLLFPGEIATPVQASPFVSWWFPWGAPALEWGIVFTIVLTGLLNTTNTIATLKGAEDIYEQKTTAKQYRASLLLSGTYTSASGFLGLVPYAPYASSLGFLQSTGIKERAPFFLGSIFFILLGIIPSLTAFLATIPHSVGNTILFVAYLQLFGSALRNLEGLRFTPKTVYRIALPALLGMTIMNIPAEAFTTIPELARPLLSNGLLMGILCALLTEGIYHASAAKKTATTKVPGTM
ncbi:uracil/xanthine transporter [Desertibacillus haloalkaliphilus]|uniref:uracil/xanthine transporter n=1 Tax=Desertibacillus haloalkaliphilus TaxID=1328930 RepID=UPI001C27A6EE|nr:uracil/xanthine transporter [Desertibacillus haloalkaliphilus]MBU8905328.1 uracil/xanthine transporter [Desertibacillus haloalkaliphilus]